MTSCTPMGPGFFIFFRTETIESGGYKDYGEHHPYRFRERKRFKFKDEEEEKAAPILEAIAEIEGPGIDTTEDLELILKMRLRQQGLIYKVLYKTWLEREYAIKWAEIKKRRRNKAIALLLLQQ